VLRALSNHSCGNGHRLAARTFNRNFRAVVALLAQGQARGELRSDFDAETAAMIIGGANEMILRMHEYVQQNSTVSQRKTLQTYVDSVFDILLRGVAKNTDAIDWPGATAAQTIPATAPTTPALLRKPGARQRPKETQCR
jgi:TetR/AcrR family transcriptional regulator